MNDLVFGSEKTMTSLDLRDMINVCRKEAGESVVASRHFVARVEHELEGELALRKTFTQPSNGQQTIYYDLTLDQCMLVGMRESKSVRRSVLAKLKEMEAHQKVVLPDFTNPAIAARAWADEVEQKQIALLALEKAQPSVDYVKKYVEASSGSLGFRATAKLLEANERELRKFLVEGRVMYKLRGSWVPYADHLKSGLFEVRTGVINNRAFTQTLFTPKGVEWLAGKWARDNLYLPE